MYTIDQWKSLLILVTAFTLGHSLTLALSVFDLIHINSDLIEILIPVTILLTCLYNFKSQKFHQKEYFKANYWMALGFGLIHGLGFSTLIKSLLGHDKNILSPLFAFNLGLEAGQLIVLGAIMVFSVVLTSFLKIRKADLNFFVSLLVFIIAGILTVTRFVNVIL